MTSHRTRFTKKQFTLCSFCEFKRLVSFSHLPCVKIKTKACWLGIDIIFFEVFCLHFHNDKKPWWVKLCFYSLCSLGQTKLGFRPVQTSNPELCVDYQITDLSFTQTKWNWQYGPVARLVATKYQDPTDPWPKLWSCSRISGDGRPRDPVSASIEYLWPQPPCPCCYGSLGVGSGSGRACQSHIVHSMVTKKAAHPAEPLHLTLLRTSQAICTFRFPEYLSGQARFHGPYLNLFLTLTSTIAIYKLFSKRTNGLETMQNKSGG